MYSTLINHNHICLLEAAFIWFIEKLLHFRERVIHLSTDLTLVTPHYGQLPVILTHYPVILSKLITCAAQTFTVI